jgi:hypothetical protein
MKLKKNEITKYAIRKSLIQCARYSKEHGISRQIIMKNLDALRRNE